MEARLMGKLSRNKGASAERRIARELTEASGIDYKRNLTETREGNSGDVLPDRDDLMPVAYCHRTGRGGERIAVLDWDDFLELVSALPAYGFLVQSKCGARPPVWDAIKEAKEAV